MSVSGARDDGPTLSGLASGVHHALLAAGATVSSAESLTGGEVAALLSATPGASATYVGGVVAYATPVKTTVLGVPEALVQEYGVVSAECALAMASGVRELTGSSYAVSTTGVAGPDEQEGKPVGLVHLALVGPDLSQTVTLSLGGSRAEIRREACARLLDEVLRRVVGAAG